MGAYILRRLLLMIPTIIGIMAISFVVVQFAPGGPVEQVIAQLTGQADSADQRLSGGAVISWSVEVDDGGSKYRGAQGLDPELIAKLEKQFGFDKPPLTRFGEMMWNYIRFDFGESFFRNTSVLDLIKEKLPVSISLGIWILIFSYAISIPLGIRKAVKDGSTFDVWTSGVIIVGYAVPSFLFGILLIVLFAGGSFYDWFPLRGLVSDNFDQLAWWQKPLDYFWHLALPLISLSLARLCDDDAADQEFLHRGDQEAICHHRPRQGPERAAGALRPCLPQCHADRHRRLPRRLHLRLLHRLAADREHLLARWPRPPRLPLGRQPRLSDRLCDALHLLAARPLRQPDLRPDLYLDRSAHRFRAEGRLMDAAANPTTSRRPSTPPRKACCRRPTSARWRNFQRQRARLLVALAVPRRCSSSACLPSSSPMTGRSSPPTRARSCFPSLIDYPEEKFGGFLAETDYRVLRHLG